MQMTNTWITGLSSFYRVGEIAVGVDNLTVSVVMQIGTQQILGASQWEVTFGSGMITRAGQVQFTIDHIKALFEISQPLDMRKRPEMKDLQLELGNIQVSWLELEIFKRMHSYLGSMRRSWNIGLCHGIFS